MNQIIEKPWGSEEVIEINERYMFKKLFMKRGHRCSLQYHETKQETIYVLSGVLSIVMGDSQDSLTTKKYYSGEYITLKARIIHRMEAIEDCFYLEASTPEMEDVIRLSDDYNR